MRPIFAIDPGNTRSAWVLFQDGRPQRFGITENEELLEWIINSRLLKRGQADVVIEMVACYGMPVGHEVFDTCVWIGRFWQACPTDVNLMYRKAVKLNLCRRTNVKDKDIRAALIERFGGVAAQGTKKKPGILYGVSKDVWAALAVAVTYADKQGGAR